MPQYLRPNSTLAAGTFTSSHPGEIHLTVDETTPDDGDFFRNSPGTDGTASCELGLSSVTDPQQSTGHILKIRGYRDVVNTPMTINLREGSFTRATLSCEFLINAATYTYTLTASEANSITNYGNLSVEIIKESTATGIGGDPSGITRAFVTWVEFEVPTPGRTHLDYVNGALTVVPLASGNYLKLVSGVTTRVTGVEIAGALILLGPHIVTWNGVS